MSSVENSYSIDYIHTLTPIRGIAALWVVLFHIDVCLHYRDLGGLIARDLTGIFSRGYLWVDFFFLLSGFVIAHVYGQQLTGKNKGKAIKSYLIARFFRLYPLHLFTLLLLILGAGVFGNLYPILIDSSWETFFATSALPSNFLMLNAMNQHTYLSWNIVSWSIGAEWWVYVCAIVLIVLFNKSRCRFIFGLLVIAFSGLVFLVYQLPDKNLDITYNYGFFRCFFEFCIGLGLYELHRFSWSKNWLKKDIVPLELIVLIGLVFHFKCNDLLIIPIFSLLILAIAYNKNTIEKLFKNPLFQYVGNISYSVYLMHGVWFMVFWFSIPFLQKEYDIEELSSIEKILFVLFFLLITIISAHFSYRYVELPGRQIAKRLSF